MELKDINWRKHFPVGKTPRPGQVQAIEFAIQTFLDGKKTVILEAPTGAGKCLKIGTECLMYDGTKKKVEDIVIGDQLMGPDSKPRNVLGTTRGRAEMFDVVPVKGATWTCNGAHVLSLVHTETGKIENISVDEYLKKSKYWRHCMKQYQPENGIDFNTQEKLDVDPYFLGVWFGDGHKCQNIHSELNGIRITKPDIEIKELCEKIALQYDLQMKIYYDKLTNCPTYSIVRKSNFDKNNLLEQMRNLVTDSQEIPKEILTSSRNERKEFLAGIIDTDGYVHHNGVEIAQKHKGIADGIQFIARSLGLSATCAIKNVKGQNYYRMQISGDMTDIPMRIARKQILNVRTQKKKVNRTGISVKSVGVGDYAGFELDGDHLFLLENFVVTHNSSIGVTLGRVVAEYFHDAAFDMNTNVLKRGTYFLTTQKILQQQYVNEFDKMRELKGVASYSCSSKKNMSCGESRKELRVLGDAAKATKWFNNCATKKRFDGCPYEIAKKEFLDSEESITNYAYMLTMSTLGSDKRPPKRGCVVIDEAHNTPEEICRFVEIEFTEYYAKTFMELKFPSVKATIDEFLEWVRLNFKSRLNQLCFEIEQEIKEYSDNSTEVPPKLIKDLTRFTEMQMKTEIFLQHYDDQNWIWNCYEAPKGRVVSFKPVNPAEWAEKYLLSYAKYRVLMSATIVDAEVLAAQLNLTENDYAFLSLPSTFPVENRPIIYEPIGSMAKDYIDNTLPIMIEMIYEIMLEHADEKGIIHTGNFKVSKFIEENLIDGRLLIQTPQNRDQIMEEHLTSKQPTILVSPSMTEGVDLKDDLSRFQIFAKVPFPNLGDPALKKRMIKWPKYYDFLTMRSFVQAVGRSVRHETDTATTYVLDSCFSQFVKKNKKMIPPYIYEALKM